MSRPQTAPYSPILEHGQEGQDHLDDYTSSGSSCFHFCSFKWNQINGSEEEGWIVRKLKKVKETSEVIAGPKWKNFIRKCSVYIKKVKNPRNNNQFQYDPESYALNFDREEEEDLFVPKRFPADQTDPNGL